MLHRIKQELERRIANFSSLFNKEHTFTLIKSECEAIINLICQLEKQSPSWPQQPYKTLSYSEALEYVKKNWPTKILDVEERLVDVNVDGELFYRHYGDCAVTYINESEQNMFQLLPEEKKESISWVQEKPTRRYSITAWELRIREKYNLTILDHENEPPTIAMELPISLEHILRCLWEDYALNWEWYFMCIEYHEWVVQRNIPKWLFWKSLQEQDKNTIEWLETIIK